MLERIAVGAELQVVSRIAVDRFRARERYLIEARAFDTHRSDELESAIVRRRGRARGGRNGGLGSGRIERVQSGTGRIQERELAALTGRLIDADRDAVLRTVRHERNPLHIAVLECQRRAMVAARELQIPRRHVFAKLNVGRNRLRLHRFHGAQVDLLGR
jgi:hypothetical protein